VAGRAAADAPHAGPDSGVDGPGAGDRGGRARVRCVAVPGPDHRLQQLRHGDGVPERRDVHGGPGDGHAEPERRHGAAGNGTIYATTSSTKELRFYDLNSAKTSQTIRFTFNQPVTNLSIRILDIDQSSNYDDFVLVNTPGYTYVAGASVDGDGRKKNSQFHSATGSAVADGSGLADVTLSYASPPSSPITYSQGDGTITGNPHIGIRSMSFTPSTC
jgi:hypothetical protein